MAVQDEIFPPLSLPYRTIDIYRTPGHPYYIISPDYRETSAGICALHYLCHVLNLLGQEAYLVGTKVFNPDLKTPLLTEEIGSIHGQRNKIPIAIYPEVQAGNPLNSLVVIRYFLNREKALMGYAVEGEYSDLRIHHLPWTRGDDPHTDGMLSFPTINSALFYPPKNPKQTRVGKYLYLNRYPSQHVDLKKLPADIKVLSPAHPLSLAELGELFRKAQVLYSYEFSNTAALALVCACPVIFIPNAKLDTNMLASTLGVNGWAMFDEPDALERACSTIHFWQTVEIDTNELFLAQLTNLIALSQAKANGFMGKAYTELSSYEKWLEARRPYPARIDCLKKILSEQPKLPSIQVIIIDSIGDQLGIHQTLDSLNAQVHPPTQLQIFSIHSKSDGLSNECGWTKSDSVWHSFFHYLSSGPCADWILVIPAGDTLEAHTLLLLLEHILDRPHAQACYMDEDWQETNYFSQPILKPDFNLDLLRSYPYIGRVLAFNPQVALELGWEPSNLNELSLIDLVFRLVEEKGAHTIEHLPEVLHHSKTALLEWIKQEEIFHSYSQIIKAHLNRLNVAHSLGTGLQAGTYRITYHHSKVPNVSIIIVMHDHLIFTQQCIETLFQRTNYSSYELLLIDQNSIEHPTCHWLKALEGLKLGQLKILSWPHSFNFSEINNWAAQQAQGEYLLFLTNFSEFADPEWLNELVHHAQRPEVGIVGGKLSFRKSAQQYGKFVYSDLVLGMGDSVDYLKFSDLQPPSGYMHRLQVAHNSSGVSHACLMIRQAIFNEIGGWDPNFKFHFSDSDLCLKTKTMNYLIVWTPYAQIHHSARQTEIQNHQFGVPAHPDGNDTNQLYKKWLSQLAHDPGYHPHFSLQQPGFLIDERKAQVFKSVFSRPVPVVLARYADKCHHGYYRVIQAFQALQQAGKIEGGLIEKLSKVAEQAYIEPDVMVIRRATGTIGDEHLKNYRAHSKALLIGECDEYLLKFPPQVQNYKSVPKELAEYLRQSLARFDRVVVGTESCAAVLKLFFTGEIRVAPTLLWPQWWHKLSSLRRQGKKPRVGWVGWIGDRTNLSIIEPIINDLADKVEWVFFGLEPLVKSKVEFHPAVVIEHYPAKLASLNLDLALVPLQINPLNLCIGNIRLLELGACGFPIICSDIEPFQSKLPVTRIRNRYKDWLEAIQMHISDLDACERAGDELRSSIHQDWMLAGKNLIAWQNAWSTTSNATSAVK